MATFPTRLLEIEFDAGVWTDVTSDVVDYGSRRGRNQESGAFETGQLVFTLRNDGRKYDPDNTAGPYYGKLRPNRRVRWRNTWPAITHLDLPGTSGAYASTPDSAALSITGDIDIRVKVAMDDWTPAAAQVFVAKYTTTGSQRAYMFRNAGSTGRLELLISGDGIAARTHTVATAPTVIDGATLWVRMTYDADNGAAGATATAYQSDDGTTWTLLGLSTVATATSPFDSTAPLEVGSFNGGTANQLAGNIYHAEIRNGIDGTIVANPSFDQNTPNGSIYTSATTLVDPQGNVWTKQGAATFPTTATTYPAFFGQIDAIEQVYGGPNDATAEITVSDFFELLNRAELPSSVFRAELGDLAPAVWFPLDEPAGSAFVNDIGVNRLTGRVLAGTTLGAAGLVVRDVGASMGLVGSDTTGQGFAVWPADNVGAAPGAILSGTGPFTVGFWMTSASIVGRVFETVLWGQVPASGSFNDEVVGFITRAADPNPGVLGFKVGHPVAGGGIVYSTVRIDDGATHFVAFVRQAGGTLKIYIDGIDRTASAVTSSLNIAGDGSFPVGGHQYGSSGLTGSLQHFAWWQTVALSAAEVATLNTAGRTPWDDDAPGTRLVRIFELVGTTGDYEIDVGEPTLQATDLGGSVLAYAQKVEETTGGFLFVARDGTVTFVGRRTAQVGGYLTSKAILVDDDSGAGIPYRAVNNPSVDKARLVTRATASREGSVAITVSDATAVAEFGYLDETHEGLLHDDDEYSHDLAEWIVNTRKTPGTRIGALTLELTKDPTAMYPAILGLELGDRVTYKRKPQNIGAVISIDMRVDAIAHRVTGKSWTTTLQLSPFNLGEAGWPVFVWDVTRWDQHVWGL